MYDLTPVCRTMDNDGSQTASWDVNAGECQEGYGVPTPSDINAVHGTSYVVAEVTGSAPNFEMRASE